ncbi:uncharacterized protein LOC123272816 [Cotesia glomerata]|uniref:CAP-Gly domain-containing protein n=1 Tax=Cotesia glomerata TaxID=32391 RepID=A0AAV7J0W0_COTGL|nr:uncharacterized protein LOC123272816 [Cotesia glomerata]XP_044595745.1 uncharacterized protein LOC123272816 [Cotesia glomerata]KAH0564413.1 hypothetical protein KQX54_011950 [Cotesia glomerata]
MEAEGSRLAHQGLHHQLTLPPGIPGLDVVRALHQTIISLRSALDSSREELRRLREIVGDFRGESYVETVERLSLENHVLRRRILDGVKTEAIKDVSISSAEAAARSKLQLSPVLIIEDLSETSQPVMSTVMDTEPENTPKDLDQAESQINVEQPSITEENKDENTSVVVITESPKTLQREQITPEVNENKEKESVDVLDAPATSKEIYEPVDLLDVPDKDPEDMSLRSVSDGDNSVISENPQLLTPEVKQESENESEELDDIELIFTTEESCRDVGLQEDLVSIIDTDHWHGNNSNTNNNNNNNNNNDSTTNNNNTGEQPMLAKYKTADEAGVCNGDRIVGSSVDEPVSSQSSSIDREESVDRFDESSNTRLNKMWSQCSVLVETDISKCGVVEEPEHAAKHAARRNTLAAPPTAYRPIIHREALAAGRRKSSTPLRPVMDRSCGARRESGAQTDISALPAQWRSESYLAHKVAHTFTTLPSKFALPTGVAGRLRLSDKTREARRVMLSDISFTSMVPELSRSADHLCHDPHSQNCFNSRGCGIRTPEVNRRESLGSPASYWPRCNLGAGLPSPCDCRLSTDLYSSRYRGSLTSIPSPGLEVVGGPPRRHSWRVNAASFDTWKVPTATSTPRPTWSSMPSSPTHVHPLSVSNRIIKNPPKRTRSKVTFQECPMIRGSLPNLRSDLIVSENSGDSTESLIDEAEDYLRRSIDSMLTISSADYWSRQSVRRRRARRHSEPDLFSEWNPPQDARPYLPKVPRDLKLDHLVKVISPEGRVLQGKVRYVGPVPGREEIHVGVELPTESGSSDGTFHGRRFFDCESERAIFVPFKKVVLAWCTT